MSTDYYNYEYDSSNPIIEKAIREGKAVSFDYTKYSGESSHRTVSDIHHSAEFGDEYIECYCHLRNERRTFKISRMSNIRLTSMPSAQSSSSMSRPSYSNSSYSNSTYTRPVSNVTSNSSGCMVVVAIFGGLTFLLVELIQKIMI